MENILARVSVHIFIPLVTPTSFVYTWKEYLPQSNEFTAVLKVSEHIFQEKLTALDCTGVFIVNDVTKYLAVNVALLGEGLAVMCQSYLASLHIRRRRDNATPYS
jgi:hypothetical protein